MTGGVLHNGDGGSSDRRGTGQEGYFIPEMVGAVTGGVEEGYFITEMAGAVTGGVLHTGDGGSSDRRGTS